MAIKANIVIDQGTNFTSQVSITDENDEPYDLTDHTAKAQMRKNYLASSFVEFNAVIPSPANTGIVTLTMDSTKTGSIEPGRYLYDVIVINSSNNVSRAVEGIVTVTPAITQR